MGSNQLSLSNMRIDEVGNGKYKQMLVWMNGRSKYCEYELANIMKWINGLFVNGMSELVGTISVAKLK